MGDYADDGSGGSKVGLAEPEYPTLGKLNKAIFDVRMGGVDSNEIRAILIPTSLYQTFIDECMARDQALFRTSQTPNLIAWDTLGQLVFLGYPLWAVKGNENEAMGIIVLTKSSGLISITTSLEEVQRQRYVRPAPSVSMEEIQTYVDDDMAAEARFNKYLDDLDSKDIEPTEKEEKTKPGIDIRKRRMQL